MIEELIINKATEAIENLYNTTITQDKLQLQNTKREFEGDITLVTFPLSKISKRSPDMTAQEIGNYLKEQIPQIEKYNVIKGFLNILFKESYWLEFFSENIDKDDFGISKPDDDKPVVIEFSSPNTNKPLHLGHIRNNLLGHSLSEILKANGKKVVKVNLNNDRGIHICKTMLAWQKWGNGETPESSDMKGDKLVGKYYVMFDKYYKDEIEELIGAGMSFEDAEKNAPLILEAQEMLRKWEEGDVKVREIWSILRKWVLEGFNITYKNLGINFDETYYESKTYMQGVTIVWDGIDKKVFYKKDDNSVWINLTADGLDEKLVLRADGTSVYITQDLATAQQRYDKYKPGKLIYVVGNEQNYHFDVLRLILKKLGKDYADNIFHLSYGMVELPAGKMKSREGTVVDADDLIEEMYETAKRTTVELGKTEDWKQEEGKWKQEAEKLFMTIGLGALKYYILKVDPQKNMLFNPEESIDFNGNTGPFIQYTYARIQSLLRKGEAILSFQDMVGMKYDQSILPKEKYIIKLIYEFPKVINEAAESYSPALVANYVYELAKEYNGYYQEIPVLKAESMKLVSFRLALSLFTGRIIKSSMKLLGIDVPDKM